MTYFSRVLFLAGILALAFPGLSPAGSPSAEWRGFWVDAWHEGFKTPGEVETLVSDLRQANCNAVFVQVRRRGDAYYHSRFEPRAADPHLAEDYDPLKDLIARAHDTSDGRERIEVHAWIVAYPVWPRRASPPPHPRHPFNRHPEWLTRNVDGETADGEANNFMLDPGHPQVQEHLHNVAMDLVTRYDIDGLHLDHIRYLDPSWGYNEVALERFQRQSGRADRPDPSDPEWMQFRRDQVTDLVRKVYLSAIAKKPEITVSAAVNTRAPGITRTGEWPTSAAYTSTLQDWHAWLEEGIIDLATPMAYMDMDGRWASAWERWSTFSKDHRYNRHVAMGAGIYLNSIPNGLQQIRSTREPTDAGNRADGVILYSYGRTNRDDRPRETFLRALTEGSGFDPESRPVFADFVPRPGMPWKSEHATGHLKGVFHKPNDEALADGATVTIAGPEERIVKTGATGFYGAVDLSPGEYQVTFSKDDLSVEKTTSIEAGTVTTLNAGSRKLEQ